MAKVINPVEGSDAEEAAEQPIEKLEEEIKAMEEGQHPVQKHCLSLWWSSKMGKCVAKILCRQENC